MKLSEFNYPNRSFNMHYDASDAQRSINSEKTFNEVKKELSDKYGDVEIEIDWSQPWFDQVKILDEKWVADHRAYCNRKQAWCDKYGCD